MNFDKFNKIQFNKPATSNYTRLEIAVNISAISNENIVTDIKTYNIISPEVSAISSYEITATLLEIIKIAPKFEAISNSNITVGLLETLNVIFNFNVSSSMDSKFTETVKINANSSSNSECTILEISEINISCNFEGDSTTEIEKVSETIKLNIKGYSNSDLNLGGKVLIESNSTSEFSVNLDLSTDTPNKILSSGSSNFEISFQFVSNNEAVFILSPDLDIIAQIDDYNDFVWERKWRNPDSFEMSIDTTSQNAQYLRMRNYVAKKKGDIVRAGMIGNRKITKDINGERMTVSGKGVGKIFDERIAFNKVNAGDGYDSFVGKAENAMKHYIEVNIVNPSDPSRKIENMSIERSRDMGKIINYKARFQKLSEILYELSKTSGLGWDINVNLETKEFVFKVLKGKIRKGIELSTEMDSVSMIEYQESYGENENTVTVAGQGEGADRQMVTVSSNDL